MDDDRSLSSSASSRTNTTIGELVGTASLGGPGFNAVRRNVHFVRQTQMSHDVLGFHAKPKLNLSIYVPSPQPRATAPAKLAHSAGASVRYYAART
jgi:hypothetical protein